MNLRLLASAAAAFLLLPSCQEKTGEIPESQVSGQPLSYWIKRLSDPDKRISLEAVGKISQAEIPEPALDELKTFAYHPDLSDSERGFAAAMLFKIGGEVDKRFAPHLAATQISEKPLGHEYDVITTAREALAAIAETDPEGVVLAMIGVCDHSDEPTPSTINVRYFFTSVWPASLPHLKELPEKDRNIPAIRECISDLEARGGR